MNDERERNLDADVEWWSECGPLPAVEQAVGPFVRWLDMLQRLELAERCDAIEALAEFRGMEADAEQLRDLCDGLVRVFTAAVWQQVGGAIEHRQHVAHAARFVIESILGCGYLTTVRGGPKEQIDSILAEGGS